MKCLVLLWGLLECLPVTGQEFQARSVRLHEPENLTKTILDSRGTDKLYGQSADRPGPWHFGERWLSDESTVVVADPQSPTGSAIEKRFHAGDRSGWNGLATLSFGGNREAYFRMRFAFSPNWQLHPGGQKIWYWGSQKSPTNFYIMMFGNGTLRFHAQVPPKLGPGVDQAVYASSARLKVGVYHTLEVHAIAQSAPGASDGAVYIWLDGEYVKDWRRQGEGRRGGARVRPMGGELVNKQWFNASAAPYLVSIGGMQRPLYWGGGGKTKTVDDYFRQAELVVKVK